MRPSVCLREPNDASGFIDLCVLVCKGGRFGSGGRGLICRGIGRFTGLDDQLTS